MRDEQFEYELEAAYWEFDARKKGYAEFKGMPYSERDAFKMVCRGVANRDAARERGGLASWFRETFKQRPRA